jgi:hypothetical protein
VPFDHAAYQRRVQHGPCFICALANHDVHWHVAPLPPGVAYDDQQLAALAMSRGILDVDREEMAELAGRIRERLVTL